MKPLPRFDIERAARSECGDSIVLAVYAPFGTDPTLSHYPGQKPRPVVLHPLVRSLAKVAALGIHVHLLIDLAGDDTYVVEIDGGRAKALVVSAWKQDMASPRALAGFLRHVRRCRPRSAIVLALEGHGSGFLPELDTSQLTTERVTDQGRIEWRTAGDGSIPLPVGSPILPVGSPILPVGSPILPVGSPILPAGPLPMSTYGLGEALRLATDGGKAPLAVVHFNNCFNMSLEVLHTIAPYADYAAGYGNYNFFTAGESYPQAFKGWLARGPRTRHGLAKWFANANHDMLERKGNHPTVGSVIRLAGVNTVARRLDALARKLTALLQVPDRVIRRDVLEKIRAAARAAQQYDTVPGFALGMPDQMTDVASLADALAQQPFADAGVAGRRQGIRRRRCAVDGPRGALGLREQAAGDERLFPRSRAAGRVGLALAVLPGAQSGPGPTADPAARDPLPETDALDRVHRRVPPARALRRAAAGAGADLSAVPATVRPQEPGCDAADPGQAGRAGPVRQPARSVPRRRPRRRQDGRVTAVIPDSRGPRLAGGGHRLPIVHF
jgi:hypothetical protein